MSHSRKPYSILDDKPCGCKKLCFLNVSKSTRDELKKKIEELTYEEKNYYLSDHLQFKECQYRRKVTKEAYRRRLVSIIYKVPTKGGEVVVCRKAFASIFGIRNEKIRALLRKIMEDDFKDNRGKRHMKLKKDATNAPSHEFMLGLVKKRMRTFVTNNSNPSPIKDADNKVVAVKKVKNSTKRKNLVARKEGDKNTIISQANDTFETEGKENLQDLSRTFDNDLNLERDSKSNVKKELYSCDDGDSTKKKRYKIENLNLEPEDYEANSPRQASDHSADREEFRNEHDTCQKKRERKRDKIENLNLEQVFPLSNLTPDSERYSRKRAKKWYVEDVENEKSSKPNVSGNLEFSVGVQVKEHREVENPSLDQVPAQDLNENEGSCSLPKTKRKKKDGVNENGGGFLEVCPEIDRKAEEIHKKHKKKKKHKDVEYAEMETDNVTESVDDLAVLNFPQKKKHKKKNKHKNSEINSEFDENGSREVVDDNLEHEPAAEVDQEIPQKKAHKNKRKQFEGSNEEQELANEVDLETPQKKKHKKKKKHRNSENVNESEEILEIGNNEEEPANEGDQETSQEKTYKKKRKYKNSEEFVRQNNKSEEINSEFDGNERMEFVGRNAQEKEPTDEVDPDTMQKKKHRNSENVAESEEILEKINNEEGEVANGWDQERKKRQKKRKRIEERNETEAAVVEGSTALEAADVSESYEPKKKKKRKKVKFAE